MSKLVVSSNRYDYIDFKCVQSLQNVDWKTVDCLIFNSSKDGDVDTILELSKAGEIVDKVIYINHQMNSLYYGLFAGMNADIYEDESMLSDEDTLSYLVECYKQTGMTIKAPDVDIETISKFVAAVTKENAETLSALLKNNLWVKTLETSLNDVKTALVRTDEVNVGMVEMFNKTSEIIETLQEGQLKTTEEIAKLANYLAKLEDEQINGNKAKNNIYVFPTYTVPNTIPKVLYIRVYSPCRYLTSFIGAYQNYLKMRHQLSCKILLAIPNFKQYLVKYDQFSRLAKETVNLPNIQKNEVFVTNEPNAIVMNAFFNMKADVHIVIDMLFGDALIRGAKVVELDAVSGIKDIEKFKIKPEKSITTMAGYPNGITIPHINGYSTATEVVKRGKYFELCGEKAYLKLNDLLRISR